MQVQFCLYKKQSGIQFDVKLKARKAFKSTRHFEIIESTKKNDNISTLHNVIIKSRNKMKISSWCDFFPLGLMFMHA